MATRTFHISFPADLAKEVEKDMKRGYYTPSEYFKHLYREAKLQRELADFADSVRVYEEEEKAGTLKKLGSLSELWDEKE